MGKKFNFQEVREKAIRAAEQEIEQGMEQIAGQGKATGRHPEEDGNGEDTPVASTEQMSVQQPPLEPAREITTPVVQTLREQEPTQNINIPIPLSLHTRLGIIKAQKRQNIKDMVVQAIDLWLDVQEGKKVVSAEK